MEDYLPKPIEFSTLITLIKRWCQGVDSSAMALPTLDWQLALKRANQNRDLAMELLREFIAHLPQAAEIIRSEWDMNLKLLDTWLADSPVQLTLSTSGQD